MQAAIALLLLPACSTAADSPDVPGCRVMECVAIGEAQQVWDDLIVTPLKVLEDSRCPIEAECVWEGRVRLSARLDMGHKTISVTLDSNEPMRINGGFLSIAEIAPDMSIAWSPIQTKDYQFGFSFAPDIMENPVEPTS
jgi:hypothetical protein